MKKMKKILLTAVLLSTSGVTLAATDACVSLLVGAGYAAKMRVKSGDFKTDWSSSFPIGKTKCQSLNGVPVGGQYTVEIQAILGKSKNCSPSITHSEGSGSITFQAWGTTLSPKCKMPSSDAVHLDKANHEVNSDGVEAAKKLNKN